MSRRFVWCMTMLGVLSVSIALPSAAEACPMCKLANETLDALPRAYMMSILFMLGMPAMVLAGFGVGFYRLSRQRDVNDGLDAESLAEPDAPADEHVGGDDTFAAP